MFTVFLSISYNLVNFFYLKCRVYYVNGSQFIFEIYFIYTLLLLTFCFLLVSLLFTKLANLHFKISPRVKSEGCLKIVGVNGDAHFLHHFREEFVASFSVKMSISKLT